MKGANLFNIVVLIGLVCTAAILSLKGAERDESPTPAKREMVVDRARPVPLETPTADDIEALPAPIVKTLPRGPFFHDDLTQVKKHLDQLQTQLTKAGLSRPMPVQFKDLLSETSGNQTSIDDQLFRATQDSSVTSADRCIILVEGDFGATSLDDSVVIATGEVSFTTCGNSIVIAASISGNEVGRDDTVHPSLLIARNEIDLAHYENKVLLHAGFPVDFAWSEDSAVLINTEHTYSEYRVPQVTSIELADFKLPPFAALQKKQP